MINIYIFLHTKWTDIFILNDNKKTLLSSNNNKTYKVSIH